MNEPELHRSSYKYKVNEKRKFYKNEYHISLKTQKYTK